MPDIPVIAPAVVIAQSEELIATVLVPLPIVTAPSAPPVAIFTEKELPLVEFK